MYEQLAVLEDLHNRYIRFVEGAASMKEEMHKFKSDIEKEVSAVLARTPLTIQPRKTPTDIDSENPTCEALPPPIVPQVHSCLYSTQRDVLVILYRSGAHIIQTNGIAEFIWGSGGRTGRRTPLLL